MNAWRDFNDAPGLPWEETGTVGINHGALATFLDGEALAEWNWALRDMNDRQLMAAAELARHGRSGVPLYLLYPAGGGAPRILPQLLTEGAVVRALQEGAAE